MKFLNWRRGCDDIRSLTLVATGADISFQECCQEGVDVDGLGLGECYWRAEERRGQSRMNNS